MIEPHPPRRLSAHRLPAAVRPRGAGARPCVTWLARGVLALALAGAGPARAQAPGPDADAPRNGDVPLAAEFAREVRLRLILPADEVAGYGASLQAALDAAGVALEPAQFALLVDRSPAVQAALLFWGPTPQGWALVGASPVSTGLPGRFEHFTTPLGVFDHSLANPDFRAEGTRNALGFRGYGDKGMRVYDFGWVAAPRGWGKGAMGELRLQMHATDRDLAEHKLGTPQSEGCVRIHASLNSFIDRRGVLDADYLQALNHGRSLWVMRADRLPTATPGRYLVVVDSQRSARPPWSTPATAQARAAR